ncbi:unnamed protein product [Peniophora sp. CBMAI 1063]|nr:unnamed protein product [Peniophora sp. CBMAI 1063]
MSDEEEPEGASLSLSKEQLRVIETIIDDEFVPYVRQTDPEFSGYGGVSPWARRRRDSLMAKNSLFRTPEVRSNRKEYGQLIDRKLRNKYNYLKIRESPFRKSLLKCLIPRPTGIQMFEQGVKKELLEESEEQDAEIYQSQLKARWKALSAQKRKEYEQEAGALSQSVDYNRSLLMTNFKTALDVLCQEDSLGGMTATTLFGFRKPVNDEVGIDMLHGRISTDNARFGADQDEHKILAALGSAWREYSGKIIPRRPQRATPTDGPSDDDTIIPSNNSGLPLFPSINVKKFRPDELYELVVKYYDAEWEYSRDLGHPRELPWDDLVRNPSDFYDTKRFDFICFNKDELQDPGKVYTYAQVLRERCGATSEDPFTFALGLHQRSLSPSFEMNAEVAVGGHAAELAESSDSSHQNTGSGSLRASPMTVYQDPKVASPSVQNGNPNAPDEATQPGEGAMRTRSQSQEEDGTPALSPPPVRRSVKRKLGEEALDSSEETRGGERSSQSGENGKTAVIQGRSQRRVRGKHDGRSKPPVTVLPAQVAKDTFASKGYQFKLSKKVQRYAIAFDDYVRGGGAIITADEADDRKQIPALTIVAYDPEWLARQVDWQGYVVSRP